MAYGGAGDKRVPEDEIERRLRELAKEVAGASRARQPEQAAGRAKNADRARAHAGRRGVFTTWVIVIAVLAAGGLITWSHFRSSPAALDDTKPVHNGPVPTVPASTAAPLASSGPPANPFAGTPANGWADGAAGIAIPAARPRGEFTAAEVRAAYQMTRKILIAGQLDWPTLRGGAPAAYADLLISRQRSAFITGLDKMGRDKQGFALSTRQQVTSFAPGSTAFVTTVVKVHGSMSAGAVVLSGTTVLRVRVNYLFAYAIEPPGHPADWMRVVQQRYGDVDFAQWDDPGGSLEPFVALNGSSAGGLCGMADGYIHPAYPNGAQSGVRPSGPSVNPYATATPSSSSAYMCQPTTGT